MYYKCSKVFDPSLLHCGVLLISVKILVAVYTIMDSISYSYCSSAAAASLSTLSMENELDGTPEGYYAFIESPKMEPPQVKLPPYIRLNKPCASK